MEPIITRCGYRCDLCLAYKPNVVEKPDVFNVILVLKKHQRTIRPLVLDDHTSILRKRHTARIKNPSA